MVTLAFAGAIGCKSPEDTAPAATYPCTAEPGGVIRIKRLSTSPGPTIDGRHEKNEWSGDHIILNSSTAQHWRMIRKDQAQPIVPDDFGISVWMAYSDDHWYVAVKTSDDKIVDPEGSYPYSGDAFELFFAGAHVNSALDMTALINRPPGQRALLQLVIPRAPLNSVAEHIADYRTDSALKTALTASSGLEIRISLAANVWTSEVAIPFKALGNEALQRRGNHNEPAKIGIDYLDYDHRAARRIAEDNWGFKPDNVYALDSREQNSNVPRCMRPVVFD